MFSSTVIYVSFAVKALQPFTNSFRTFTPSFSRSHALFAQQENVVHWLQYYAFKWPAFKLVLTIGGGIRRSIEKTLNSFAKLKRLPLEQKIRVGGDDVAHELTLLIGLMTLFVVLLYVRRVRRRQRAVR